MRRSDLLHLSERAAQPGEELDGRLLVKAESEHGRPPACRAHDGVEVVDHRVRRGVVGQAAVVGHLDEAALEMVRLLHARGVRPEGAHVAEAGREPVVRHLRAVDGEALGGQRAQDTAARVPPARSEGPRTIEALLHERPTGEGDDGAHL
eukprot:2061996-Prymnesium_polylepis.2